MGSRTVGAMIALGVVWPVATFVGPDDIFEIGLARKYQGGEGEAEDESDSPEPAKADAAFASSG